MYFELGLNAAARLLFSLSHSGLVGPAADSASSELLLGTLEVGVDGRVSTCKEHSRIQEARSGRRGEAILSGQRVVIVLLPQKGQTLAARSSFANEGLAFACM